ncbi:MAG: sensor histidine kinase, partial [Ktedonobacteraceae bacterium]
SSSLTAAESHASLEHLLLWIERAIRQVKAESRLINDLLDATNIQAEHFHVSLEPCDLVQIVSDAVNNARLLADTRTIHLLLPEQSPIPVLADRVRIDQVIADYLTNALKYSTAPQPITVGIALEEHEARVWVKDAGLGLSPEAQRSLWNRFQRTSRFAEYTNLGTGGLGLGLYISQAIIRQHGGRVGVESVETQGSTFWFTLPLAEQ